MCNMEGSIINDIISDSSLSLSPQSFSVFKLIVLVSHPTHVLVHSNRSHQLNVNCCN